MINPDRYPTLPPPHGFGVVRLKLLLALCRSPELDQPRWQGTFQATIGRSGTVKAAVQVALEEIILDEDSP